MKKALKRSLSLLLAITIIFGSAYVGLSEVDFDSAFAVEAKAASVSDLTFTSSSNGKSYSVTDCNENATGALVIPATYNGVPVIGIGTNAFRNCTNITSITIPDSITNIGDYAFRACTNLASIIIPDSVTSVGSSAFNGCTSLTSVTISDSVTSIGVDTFYGCISLESISIPSSVTNIGESAFYGCTSLTSINIPDSVTNIDNYAFCNTGYYNDLSNWLNGVLYIGNHLIEAKDTLSGSCVIVDGTKNIVDSAFSSCESITSITIPNSVTNIGDDAFSWCTNIEKVNWCAEYISDIDIGSNIFDNAGTSGNGIEFVFGDFVETIPQNLFSFVTYEPKITSVVIGDGITSICSNVFSNCTYLTSVLIGNSVTTIGDSAFSYCTNLTSINIPDSVTYIGDYAFSNCKNLTSITIPDSVTNIGVWAFASCTNLTSVIIGNGITCIDYGTFESCSSLPSIIIPNSVTRICSWAFSGCTNLTSIDIPDSVTNIGEFIVGSTAYYYNETNWENGVLYIGVHLIQAKHDLSGSCVIKNGTKTIAWSAFIDCTNLTSITIPDSVTAIGDSAFYNCDNLTSIIIPASVTNIDNYAFNGCTSLTSISVDVANEIYCSVDGVLFSENKTILLVYPEGKTDASYVIPNGITSIGCGAFQCCSNLTSITIPNSVTSIGSFAFNGCTSLTGVYYSGFCSDWANIEIDCLINATIYCVDDLLTFTLSSDGKSYSVTDCNENAFGSLVIPVTYKGVPVTGIGVDAFRDCTSLTSITIPDSVTTIGEAAFSNCKSLTSITIPDSVTIIGEGAFSNCKSLTSITIPDSVTNIGGWAFAGCTNLMSVIIGNGITCIDWDTFRDCSSLTSVIIPDSVTSIGAGAFNGCRSLESITIPNSVTRMEDCVFWDCISLTSITIPDGVMGLCDNTFYNTGYYNDSSNWEDDVLYIGNYLIDARDSINGPCVIKDGTKTIVHFAFGGCTNLTSVTFPNSLTSIGYYAFDDCDSLTSITIPNSITSIGYGAFNECDNLEYVFCPDEIFSFDTKTIGELNDCLLNAKWHYGTTDHIAVKDDAITPTCTATGKTEGSHCSVCNTVIKAQTTVPATGHSYTSNVTTPATHTTTGVKTYTCGCGHTYTETIAKLTEHTHTAIITAPTCTEKGYTTHICACGDTYVSDYVNAKGHTISDWIIDKQATCTVNGSKHTQCTVCGVTIETKTIIANGHTAVKDVAIPATCTTAGKAEGSHCSVCNTVIKAQTTVPATGHSYTSKVTTPATHTTTGVKTYTCGCGHTYTETIAKLTEHTHTAIVTKPTCTTKGYTTYTCACGDTYVSDYVNAKGHALSDWIIDKQATCTVNGSKHTQCTVCGVTIETKTIVAPGHTAVKDVAIPATCTTAGKTEGSHCSVCNAVIVAQNVVNAKGHTISDWIVYVSATVSEPGLKQKECTVCREILVSTVIPQLKPATPKVKAVNTIAGMNVTWNAVDGAVKYGLYKRLGTDNSWTFVTTTTATSYADNNTPLSGSYYVYTVKAYNSADMASDYIKANCASVQRVIAPVTKAVNAVNGINVTWNKVSGASKYVVLRRLGTGSVWETICTTTSTSYLDKNVIPGIYYLYSIRAVNNTGYSEYDVNKRITIQRVLAPTAVATNLTNGVQITWSKATGATKYNVYRRTAGSSTWALMGTTTGTSLVDKSVTNGTYYVYSIRAINGTGYSAFDTSKTDTIQPITAPTAKVAKKPNGVQVSWNSVSSATKYNVYRRLGGTSTWVYAGQTTGTSFIDTGVVKGKSYAYSIRAINGTGYSAYNSTKCAAIKYS